MYELLISSIIFISLRLGKTEQAEACSFFLLSYFLIKPLYVLAQDYYPLYVNSEEGVKWINSNLNNHYLITNSARIIQMFSLSIALYYLTYRDRKAFIPITLSTVIIVLYLTSCFFILKFDSIEIQRFISDQKYILGGLVIASLFDYGDKFYDRLYSSWLFRSNSYVGRIYTIIANREVLEKKKEGEMI